MKKQRTILLICSLIAVNLMLVGCQNDITGSSNMEEVDDNKVEIKNMSGYWTDSKNNLFINFNVKGKDVGELIYHYPNETNIFTFKLENINDNEFELLIINKMTGSKRVENPYTINVSLNEKDKLVIEEGTSKQTFSKSDEESYKAFLEPLVQLEDLEGYWFESETNSFVSFDIKEGEMGELTYHNLEESLRYTFKKESVNGSQLDIMVINSNIENIEEPYVLNIYYDSENSIRIIDGTFESNLTRSNEEVYNDFNSELVEDSNNGIGEAVQEPQQNKRTDLNQVEIGEVALHYLSRVEGDYVISDAGWTEVEGKSFYMMVFEEVNAHVFITLMGDTEGNIYEQSAFMSGNKQPVQTYNDLN